MFKAEKDERLQQIETESAAIAFFTIFFAIMGLGIVRTFVSDAGLLSNPDFLLMVLWLLSGMVFIGMEVKRGYYSTVREENTRTAKLLLSTRRSLLSDIIWLAVFMFLINSLGIFSDESTTITEDMMDAGSFALIMGLIIWFFTARKSRRKNQ